MLTGSIGERIGAAHSAVAVEDHEIASGEPVERCGHVAGRERNRGSDLHRRRRVALGDIGPEDGTPHLVLGAVDAMPPAADQCREQRCQGRMGAWRGRSEEHTSEIQSLMRISYAVFCLKTKNGTN